MTREPWDLYIVDAQYGSLGYEGFHDWPILQGRYVLCLLFEYAATLGLIDVAYVEPAGVRRDFTHMWGTETVEGFIVTSERQARALYVKGPALLIECVDAETATVVATHELSRP